MQDEGLVCKVKMIVKNPVGVYIHIPFCRAKCNYCDFNSFAGHESLFQPYLAALGQEIERAAAQAPGGHMGRSVYIGGGTPTVLPPADLVSLLHTARAAFALPAHAEITVEANPGAVDAHALERLRAGGVNRISLGVQSFDDRLLDILGRIHSARQARQTVRDIQATGFKNLNIDLMFGLPTQTLENWQASLQHALALTPQHLSLYALSVEKTTPLAQHIATGALPEPDDDLAADMYILAKEMLNQAGYLHYEISNWAQPGYECQHNLIYWRNQPYIGVGAGAHSWWGGKRWANLNRPTDYVAAIERGALPIQEAETIGRSLEMGETMIMGLRLLHEGVALTRFQTRFGVAMDQVYAGEIDDLVAQGLVERTPTRIRLSKRGHLLGNQVFGQFLI